MSLAVVILAAGKGTRMKSALPKVLHPIAGKSMLEHVLASARTLNPEKICVVYGHEGEKVRQAISQDDVVWVEQKEQLGTGHAVAQAMPFIEEEKVLVLYGDVPLTRQQTLSAFIETVTEKQIGLMTLEMDDPSGYGRIIRDGNGQVCRIVEQKDANEKELSVCEINTGIVAATSGFLNKVLPALSAENAQGEYYLTDIIAMAVAQGLKVQSSSPKDAWEVDGVNDRVQLARLERVYQQVQAEKVMRAGASLADPARIDIRGNLVHGQDVSIDVNCVFEGEVQLGSNVVIEANCILKNCTVSDGAVIKANSHLEDAQVGEACQVGPYGRLRPGSVLANGARVGNFVEVKKSELGEGAKVNHLTYIGDAKIGRDVNVGAGTITCNYDGINKFQTVIEDEAFIGSNSSLVAPVRIGKKATVGAGSTIAKDVADEELAIARGKQRNIQGWKRPEKKH